MFKLFSIVFQAAIVIAIPFMVSHIGKMLLEKVVNQEFFQVPILKTLAHIQGVLAGLLLMRLELDKSYFDLERMFLADGPWNINLSEFLFERANVFVYDSFLMLKLLGQVPSNEGFLATLIAVILPLLIVLLSMRFWETKDALRALLASAGIALWTGWFTVYLVCTVFWTLYLLNFWTLLIAILYIQYRKSTQGGHH